MPNIVLFASKRDFNVGKTITQDTSINEYVNNLRLFGMRIPQEKVYVHLDNTCYFLGDTIWFAAYTHRTDKNAPSDLSRVLYAELWNQDGYLVERQLIKMEKGHGYGQFALPDTLYGGYYELRAYTRWQLNWGETEHPHTRYAEDWFLSPAMAREYYRDYDKLYSRVFPVYDKPKVAGQFLRDMTLRPLRRYFKDAPKESDLVLSLFPESGSLISGAECLVAFEATSEKGEWKNGVLEIHKSDGSIVTTAHTENRGRGTFKLTPQAGESYEAVFSCAREDEKDLKYEEQKRVETKVQLPDAKTSGAAMNINSSGNEWNINITMVGTATQEVTGLTIMHEGVTEYYQEITTERAYVTVPDSLLQAGVNQATLFTADGRVLADRLFFVTKQELYGHTIEIKGRKDKYEPFERINLDIKAALRDSSVTEQTALSIAIRDAVLQDYTYDSGNIMTEMLLASEIKGFIPQPEWFFESDDEDHRHALDLLMLTHGWRRFNWVDMSNPDSFIIKHPVEYTQVLTGDVNTYTPYQKEDEILKLSIIDALWHSELDSAITYDLINEQLHQTFGHTKCYYNANHEPNAKMSLDTHIFNNNSIKDVGSILDSQKIAFIDEEGNLNESTGLMSVSIGADVVRQYDKQKDLKNDLLSGRISKEVRVHAEYVQPGSESVVGNVDTQNGRFLLTTPDFYGCCVLFLAASDTTLWKKHTPHQWVKPDEEDYPEFSVRLSLHYPHFVKPYSFFQTHHVAPKNTSSMLPASKMLLEDGIRFDTDMEAVTVRARHGGLRRFDPSKPAYKLDAYEAFNVVCDAGFTPAYFSSHTSLATGVARTYVGDMNLARHYDLDTRYGSHNGSRDMSPLAMNKYSYLSNLDSVFLYTDYSPREEGSTRYDQANQPSVSVDLRLIPDGGQRVTYRDRRYILQGFNVAEDFYHPNYSNTPLPEAAKDYRRTLYWNPALRLDREGHASVSFYNNSHQTYICVKANGQASDGTLLFTK